MAKIKEKLLTVRFTQAQLSDYKIATELEGGTMSSVTRTFVFKKIRDAKERDPQAFTVLHEMPDKQRRVLVAEAKDEKKRQGADTVRKDGRRRASGGRKSS